jgi:hypothetical protein
VRATARLTAVAWFIALAGAFAVPGGAVSPQQPIIEPPALVLAKYEEALDLVPSPKNVRFEYSIEQAGPHDLSETHRVYRSGLTERDEILSVGGQSLPKPSIRIIRDRVNHYNVGRLAPRVREYVFSYIGEHHDGARVDYVFSTVPRGEATTSAFRVTGITIDGIHYLPRAISYATGTEEIRGKGTFTFWPQEEYWVIQQATAQATIGGKLARERLSFHNYDFPNSLPASTFVEPRTGQNAAPGAEPTTAP